MTFYRPLALISFLSLGLCACGADQASTDAGGEKGAGSEVAGASHAQSRDQLPGGMPNFTPAEGWTAYPPENTMRLANYRIPGVEGEGDGAVVVAVWDSKLGGLEANVKRWMGQAGLVGTPSDLSGEQAWEIEADGIFSSVFHLDAGAGTAEAESDAHGAKGSPLLVAYIEKPSFEGCWTVKVTGPSATIKRNKADFETFLKGL